MNHSSLIENQAKQTLYHYSQDEHTIQWQHIPSCIPKKTILTHKTDILKCPYLSEKRTNDEKNKNRMINEFRICKDSVLKARNDYLKARNIKSILVPKKISLDSHSKQQMYPRILRNKENPTILSCKPNRRKCNIFSQRTIESRGMQNKMEQKQEKSKEDIDYLKYWIRHRFEDSAISELVKKIRQKQIDAIR